MKKLAVIGHPISHSKSPLIHNYWIKKYNLDAVYNALDIEPENLKSDLSMAIQQGYSGFNLTLPHKELALEFCDEIDDVALKIGAINTVLINDDKIYGTNTDAQGFIESILQQCPAFDFTAGPATILGAGGAARAIVYGLLKNGAPKINLMNRTRKKAQILAEEFGSQHFQIYDWADIPKALPNTSVLVNTTSLGMKGQALLNLPLEGLSQEALVVDIVYNPLMTGLLLSAQENENPYVTGIGMLLHQARLAFHAWFGIMPDIDEDLKNIVLKAL